MWALYEWKTKISFDSSLPLIQSLRFSTSRVTNVQHIPLDDVISVKSKNRKKFEKKEKEKNLTDISNIVVIVWDRYFKNVLLRRRKTVLDLRAMKNVKTKPVMLFEE